MSHCWFIEPREPIVARDGRSAAAIDEGAEIRLPLPSTMAGMVRACFVQDTTKVDPEELLGIRIRGGPWFGHRKDDGSFQAYVPAPEDARVGDKGMLYRATLEKPPGGSVLLWPWKGKTPFLSGQGSLLLVQHRNKDDAGRKTLRAAEVPGQRYWSLERAVQWAMSSDQMVPWCHECDPVERETRIHVSLDDKTGTAEQGMLYGTPGLRFRDGYGFALEVDGVPDRLSGIDVARAVFLGGEGRVSFRKDISANTLPAFSQFRAHYENATTARLPSGIRLQLMTPAWLSPDAESPHAGWLPSWAHDGRHPGLPKGLRLRLVGVCLSRAIAVSGWDMQWQGRGGPRAVRRLAPAGSIYYVALEDDHGKPVTDAKTFVDVAAALWARAIESAPVNGVRSNKLREQHLAHPEHDGFGRMLPGFFWTTQNSHEESAT